MSPTWCTSWTRSGWWHWQELIDYHLYYGVLMDSWWSRSPTWCDSWTRSGWWDWQELTDYHLYYGVLIDSWRSRSPTWYDSWTRSGWWDWPELIDYLATMVYWLTHDGLGAQPDATAEQEEGGGTSRNWLIILLLWFTELDWLSCH
jgi:hypothetical protein